MTKCLLIFSSWVLIFLLGCQGHQNFSANPVVCPGTIKLAWDPVTHDGDGNPVTVGGYRIHYGNTAGGPYPAVVDVGNTTQTALTNICPGTYYIVATAYLGNIESGYSNEASTTESSPTQSSVAKVLRASTEVQFTVPNP